MIKRLYTHPGATTATYPTTLELSPAGKKVASYLERAELKLTETVSRARLDLGSLVNGATSQLRTWRDSTITTLDMGVGNAMDYVSLRKGGNQGGAKVRGYGKAGPKPGTKSKRKLKEEERRERKNAARARKGQPLGQGEGPTSDSTGSLW
jgi:hypothetical protein